MAKSERDQITELRRMLENPYAYVEQIEEFAVDGARAAQAEPQYRQIAVSRKLLENPYAYLDGEGNLNAEDRSSEYGTRKLQRQTRPGGITGRHSLDRTDQGVRSDREIQQEIRRIHNLIWRDRTSIWGAKVPSDAVDMLDPAIALSLLGYECRIEEGLGQFRTSTGRIEVAGLIDTAMRTVHVSRQFPTNVRTFTTAHELGHAALHPNLSGIHRDRPLDGVGGPRERVELEADRFATLFLMPEKLVRSRFLELFGEAPFGLSEETSFAVAGISLSQLGERCRTRRDLARLLASTERYDGRHFTPLSTQFHVSTEAMAIRLEELSLLIGG